MTPTLRTKPMDERTTVIHVRDMQPGDVYIGRAVPRRRLEASVLGNPFIVGKDSTREEVIAKYRQYIERQSDLLTMLPTLKGHRLACWCAPEPCHGDVLVELLNERAYPS